MELSTASPNAIDLEAAVIGAVLIEKDAIHDVLPIIKNEEVFYNTSNRLVYKAIIELLKDGEDIDTLTVFEQLKRNGTYNKVGGKEKASYYILKLTEKVNSSAHITTHANILVEYYMKREMIAVNLKVANILQKGGESIEAFDLMQNKLTELNSLANQGTGYKTYKELLYLLMNKLGEIRDGKSNKKRIYTKLKELDYALKGIEGGDFLVLAARPGMGKTALVVSIINNAGIRDGKKILFFSLEMASNRIMMRGLASECRINSDKMRDADFTNKEWEKLIEVSGAIAHSDIVIDCKPGIKLDYVQSKIRDFVIEYGEIDLVVIDYLQLMTGEKGVPREQVISGISRGLKESAKTFNVPIIALAQLNREVEKRGGDKKPIISDLRESGAIEQDADQILFIYRPEMYGITEDDEGNSTFQSMEIIIAKNRHGSTGVAKQRFIPQYTVVCDFESEIDNFESQKEEQEQYEPMQNSNEFDR